MSPEVNASVNTSQVVLQDRLRGSDPLTFAFPKSKVAGSRPVVLARWLTLVEGPAV
jgi:hypothetical protein